MTDPIDLFSVTLQYAAPFLSIQVQHVSDRFTYILYLKYDRNKKEILKKDIAILSFFSIVIALCKIVYLPLCLLLFILPNEKFKSAKIKRKIIISILTAAILLNLIWLIYCSRFLIEFNIGVNSGEQVKYILTHPIDYIFILFRTINMTFQTSIVGLCGEGLGVYDVQASVIFICPCILMFAMLFIINDEKEVKIDSFTKLMCLFVFLSIVLLIYTSLYIQWTSLQRPIIHGVQARYFLPILLLMAIVLNNHKIEFNEKLSKKYVYLFMLFLNLNVVAVTFFTYIKGVGAGIGIE